MGIKQIIGVVLIILGVVGLIMGVLGIFGNNITGINPWALTILGIIFFIASIGLLKTTKDTKV